MVLLRGLTRPCRCPSILEMQWGGQGVAAQLELPEHPCGFRESREVLSRAGGSARDRAGEGPEGLGALEWGWGAPGPSRAPW